MSAWAASASRSWAPRRWKAEFARDPEKWEPVFGQDHAPGKLKPFFCPRRVAPFSHGATRFLRCHCRPADGGRFRAGGFRRADPAFRRPRPERHSGRRRIGDRGRRLVFDGSGRAGLAARRLCGRAQVARVHAGAARGRQRQGRRHLFRMGRPVRPKSHHAVAADRRPGIGRRCRRRDRQRALPARLAHLDFRRAHLRQAIVRP